MQPVTIPVAVLETEKERPTMLAANYTGDRTIVIEGRDPAALRPGEVRIAVAYVGICGTDLHIFHGDMDARVSLPATIGHEMSGTIAEVAPDVEGWAVRRCGDGTGLLPAEVAIELSGRGIGQSGEGRVLLRPLGEQGVEQFASDALTSQGV